jgi:hypothetical protein
VAAAAKAVTTSPPRVPVAPVTKNISPPAVDDIVVPARRAYAEGLTRKEHEPVSHSTMDDMASSRCPSELA